MKAWVYQDHKQVEKVGPEAASWYAGWLDPEGKRRCKSCGPGTRGKKRAEQHARKVEGQIAAGTYQADVRQNWADFRKLWEARVGDRLDARTRLITVEAMHHFERIIKPGKIASIRTEHVEDFITARMQERGRRTGDKVSPATVNKELRHLRAVIRKAWKWGLLARLPEFEFLKESQKLPVYVAPEHFAEMYAACKHAKYPCDQPYPAAEWWKGVLSMAYMTGWRIGEILAFRRQDFNEKDGTAVTRAEDNKGNRDEIIRLHPVVIDHLKRVPGFDLVFFPWNYNARTLYTQFRRIQEKAGIRRPCQKEHKHSPFCHVYGFHALRKAFATMNAERMKPEALQAMMRHKSFETTKRYYIDVTRQLDAAVASLHVPEVLKATIA